ncbi:dinitrogenase iron-molybdenum cofactor biosynthesis protein [Methanosarcina sp. KYL-1]|uniref:NifB/NifX family molybdenum-iron cluster-binding protein n=1 Tax=Methanosarcina sp. KYL-1 TaxID=2602068 RepID=UPI002101C6E3|nr:dinitrogenase iron-molybdenum cofactor biosynthesis protein [Methanosarcina sp. KYL-1]
MKICVTATSWNLDSTMDPHFGRAPYFIIIDPETMEFEVLENPGVSVLGKGIQVAQAMVSKGIDVLLTGKIGPDAFRILSEEGVSIVTGASGSIQAAVEQFKKGELRPADGPTWK